jgi:hypothetical protein
MRFFEFAITPGSNTVSSLVDLAKDPKTEPGLKQEILSIFRQLKSKAESEPTNAQTQTEDPSSDAALIAEIEDDEAYWQRILNSDPRLKAIAEKKAQEAFNVGTALATDRISQDAEIKLKMAIRVAESLGKNKSWAEKLRNMANALGDPLALDFLTAVAEDKALKPSFSLAPGNRKYKLRDVLEDSIVGILDNRDFMTNVYNELPLGSGTGQGSGIGPGETLLALLIPGAKKPARGDLVVPGVGKWEVKGSGYSGSKLGTGWLDATKEKVSGSALRKIFVSEIKPFVADRLNDVISNGKKEFTVDEGIHTEADFRPTSLSSLKAVMALLEPEQKVSIIRELYTTLFPETSVNKDTKSLFDDFVQKTPELIASESRTELAKMQAKLGMIEYAIGYYECPNFFVVNTTSDEIGVVSGLEAALESLDEPSLGLSASTITMSASSSKASSGINLPDESRARKEPVAKEPKAKVPRAPKKSSKVIMANDPKFGVWSKYNKDDVNGFIKQFGRDRVNKAFHSLSMDDFEQEFGLK